MNESAYIAKLETMIQRMLWDRYGRSKVGLGDFAEGLDADELAVWLKDTEFAETLAQYGSVVEGRFVWAS